jgi:hypothetical protein
MLIDYLLVDGSMFSTVNLNCMASKRVMKTKHCRESDRRMLESTKVLQANRSMDAWAAESPFLPNALGSPLLTKAVGPN